MSLKRSISLRQYNCAEIKQDQLSNYSHKAEVFYLFRVLDSRVLTLLNLNSVQKQLQNVLFKHHWQYFYAGVTFILKVSKYNNYLTRWLASKCSQTVESGRMYVTESMVKHEQDHSLACLFLFSIMMWIRVLTSFWNSTSTFSWHPK